MSLESEHIFLQSLTATDSPNTVLVSAQASTLLNAQKDGLLHPFSQPSTVAKPNEILYVIPKHRSSGEEHICSIHSP